MRRDVERLSDIYSWGDAEIGSDLGACGRTNGMCGQDVVIAVKAVSRNRLAQGVQMTDTERPKGSTNHPLIPLSDENIAVAEAMGVNPATKSIRVRSISKNASHEPRRRGI
jgi:hypothetical protein